MGLLSLFEGINLSPDGGLTGRLSEGFVLSVHALGAGTLRVAVVPAGGLALDRTWMVAPGATADDDGPLEGRDRLSLAGFDTETFAATEGGFESDHWRVVVENSPFRLTAWHKRGGAWHKAFEDRPHGAWQWFEKRGVLKHFQLLAPGAAHYGLGDKTGPLDRTGRRLRCLQSDALGYDAERSDPLYKHAPWLMVDGAEGTTGLLYDTMGEITFDVGAEHSNYFPRFRHVEVEEQGAVFYALGGQRVQDVVPALHWLTGKPAFLPRWAMGFAFTTMHHADHSQAQLVITDFAREARGRGLPMSAVHLGSGYTAGADGLRYVFNWNTARFPDRSGFFADLKAMGLHTAANIKPVLLTGHARFGEAKQNGWFVQSGKGGPAIEMFWGGHGVSLDFTAPATLNFWREGVQRQVLEAGFDGVWNDNNECELWDEAATLDGFGKPITGMDARPVHAILMMRTSLAAQKNARPDERPYSITRAGPIGIARYGETWSGDNATSWHTLKWNLRQGLSMALSGMPLTGHDIGGFAGPPPGPELLVRWFQMMALHPRCVMNSWKVDHDNIPNLPWMHGEVFEEIKRALILRYRFLPLIYQLAHECHETGQPIIAPTFYHFKDMPCRVDSDSFMLGPDVLVAPVVDEEVDGVEVYLPATENGWMDFHSGRVHPGGEGVRVSTPLDRFGLFVRCGAVVPLATRWHENAPHDALAIVPTVFDAPSTAGEATWWAYWDDGRTAKAKQPRAQTLAWSKGRITAKGGTPLPDVFDAPAWHDPVRAYDVKIEKDGL
ncbi:MAG: TIM-barrel domain-containing protein [Pseudomonadota bacterium]